MSVHPDSNGATNYSHTRFLQENSSESNEVPQLVSIPASTEAQLDTLTDLAQHHRKPALLESNTNESNFMKSWITNEDQPTARDSMGAISNWNCSQIDSSVENGKIKECIVDDSEKERTERTDRNALNQPGNLKY